MRTGILCAGDTEAAPFIRMLDKSGTVEKAMLTFYEGKIDGAEVVVLFSGVCKVNAAIAAQILIDTFKCEAIINAGTAGGIDKELRVFDTVVSTETAYHDMGESILTDFHPYMDSVYFPSDKNLLSAAEKAALRFGTEKRVFFGRVVTGEQFIEQDRREYLSRRFSPLSADMETAGAAHACYVNRIPFISVRTITDTAEYDGTDQFEKNCAEASEIAAEFVRLIIEELHSAVSLR